MMRAEAWGACQQVLPNPQRRKATLIMPPGVEAVPSALAQCSVNEIEAVLDLGEVGLLEEDCGVKGRGGKGTVLWGMSWVGLIAWGMSLIGILAVVAVVYVLVGDHLYGDFVRFADIVEETGNVGFVLMGIFIVVMSVLPTPFFSLSLITSGFIWGTWIGFGVCYVSGIVGSCCAYALARFTLRDSLLKRANKSPRFKYFQRAVKEEGLVFVLALRVSPLSVAFASLGLGATRCRFRTYVVGTSVGFMKIPLHTWVGSQLRGVDEARGAWRDYWYFIVVGICVMICVMVFCWWWVRGAVDRWKEDEQEDLSEEDADSGGE